MPSNRRRILPPAEFLHECFIYSHRSGELRWKTRPIDHFTEEWLCRRWNTRYAGTIAGNINVHGYRIVKVDRLYPAHRIVWKMVTDEEPPEMLDHIDGDRLNNAWKNLRVATQTEQNWNTRTRECVSGYRGVSRNGKHWKAQISIGGVIRHLGTFDTPDEASAVYQAYARAVHGKFYRSRNPPD